MKKTILVAIKKPNQPLEVREIEDKLEVLQEIVEGYIEAIYPMENLEEHSITIFGNEEAKLNHLPSNFWLYEKKDCMCGTAALSCSLWPTHISEQGRGNSIIPFGYHNSNVLENFTKAKLNDADRKFEKFSASALFIFCEPNFLLGNPKGTDIWSLELNK